MIHEALEFHNISHTTTVAACPGVSLHRVPDSVRAGLNEVAQEVALCPSHAEIRFITAAPVSKLTLYSGGHHEYAFVYCGDYLLGEHCIEPGQSLTIELAMPAGLRELDPNVFRRFPSHVWRVRLSGTNRIHFVKLDTGGHDVRPPLPSEKPARRWLAYGSSITQGFSASRLAKPWTQLAATLLGYDLFNLGFGGSCHAEPAMADYIAGRDDWDVCTLELGINLLDKPLADGEFRARAGYLLDRLTSTRPDSTVVVITPFLSKQDLVGKRGPKDLYSLEDFRKILREEVAARPDRANLHLIEGREILDRADGLSADLCHPSDFGHALMAANFTTLLTR
jgi:hypothetical protein